MLISTGTLPTEMRAGRNGFQVTLLIENVTDEPLCVYDRSLSVVLVQPTEGTNKPPGIYITRIVKSNSPIEIHPDTSYVAKDIKGSRRMPTNEMKGSISSTRFIHPLKVESNKAGMVYIEEFDIVLSFKENNGNELHPFSKHGIIEQVLLKRVRDVESFSTGVGFLLVNSADTNVGPRYINVADCVVEIKPVQLDGYEPGLYVKGIGESNITGATDASSAMEYYPLEDIDKDVFKYRLFKTHEMAERHTQEQLNEIEKIKRKEEADINATTRASELAELKHALDHKSVVRKDLSEEMSFARREHYESLKDSSDTLKWGFGLATVAIALLKSGKKASIIASSLTGGMAPLSLIGGCQSFLMPKTISYAKECLDTVTSGISTTVHKVVESFGKVRSYISSWFT